MSKIVACTIDGTGMLSSFNEKGKASVFTELNDAWVKTKEMDVNLSECTNLAELRERIREIILFYSDCKILITKNISGVAFFALEKDGFEIWEWSGKAEEVIQEIMPIIGEKECCISKRETEDKTVVPLLVEKSPGKYEISIKEIQGGAGITSKQALMPIIQQKEFEVLEIKCIHVPPWLELMALEKGYQLKQERKDVNEVKLIISR